MWVFRLMSPSKCATGGHFITRISEERTSFDCSEKVIFAICMSPTPGVVVVNGAQPFLAFYNLKRCICAVHMLLSPSRTNAVDGLHRKNCLALSVLEITSSSYQSQKLLQNARRRVVHDVVAELLSILLERGHESRHRLQHSNTSDFDV